MTLEISSWLELANQLQPDEPPDWPERHVVGPDEETPAPYHIAQNWAWDTRRRFVAMLAGTQGGKTGFGPWWLWREIYGDGDEYAGRGAGDYLAVTATFDLFKLKLLPALQQVFVDILGVGRYWSGDRIMELRDPRTGRFLARRSTDRMWGRIILRSADAEGGLESSTAKGAWLDEAGQPRFSKGAFKAIRRRCSLHRARVLITTTLYDHGWVKELFIDPVQEGGIVTLEESEGAIAERTDSPKHDTCLIQFDSVVNPTYSREEYDEARETLPDDEFQMFYRGRAGVLRYLIYDCFDKQRDTCPRFPIPDDWKRYIGLDFGDVHMAAAFYAEEPGTDKLYCYREYLAGNELIKTHAENILAGEPGRPSQCYGGSKSERQWRQEFAAAGLPVKPPVIKEVGVGINRVYGCHKRQEIVYFDDLMQILHEKATYSKKRDRQGNVTDEIADKARYHLLDAERYIISAIRGSKGGWTWRGS